MNDQNEHIMRLFNKMIIHNIKRNGTGDIIEFDIMKTILRASQRFDVKGHVKCAEVK